ncbi:MAG TPA: folylpolyglutamate synthase/dihydrofolate synthase family protein [Ktedonosporobacter sp.]|nr:folylpolyglutamate synthase/dihydrofolate synthase family protein [Ktedonosporobacter sp.]
MNYKEALAYIYSFTDYERGSSYTRDRTENQLRVSAVLDLLGNPHRQYSSTLIAGTKGKGSTAALIERVLREAGLRTGLYTQPDLHTFRERMRVNGHLISEEEVAKLIPEIQAAVETVEARHEFGPFITYEIGTALAFLFFYRQQIEHAVVEVGLGGRLDATNILQPLVSVITSISYDHMHILGDTLAKIATEKAGIIKPNGIIVTSAQSPEALLAIAAVSRQRQARMVRIGPAESDPAQTDVDAGQLPVVSYRYRPESHNEEKQRFTIWTPESTYADLEIPLVGRYQLENATVALATLEELRRQGVVWDEDALRRGFAAVHWPARIEVVGHNPTIVVDGAHNADSVQKMLQALRTTFTFHRLIVVLSLKRDKDLARIVRALADVDMVIVTRMNNPTAIAIEALQELLAEHAPHVAVYTAKESNEAMNLALDLADGSDLICATGSLYLAAEALRWAAARGDERAAAEIEGVDH